MRIFMQLFIELGYPSATYEINSFSILKLSILFVEPPAYAKQFACSRSKLASLHL